MRTPIPTARPLPRWLVPLLDLGGRAYLGLALLIAGGAKVGRPLTAQRAIQAYELLPHGVAGVIGLALPFLEIVLGLLLVVGLFVRPAAILSALLMLAFFVGIAQAWARGLTIDCGCFGGGGQIGADQTNYPGHLLFDLSLAAAGVWLARRGGGRVFSADAWLARPGS